jgi:hypothetical protein
MLQVPTTFTLMFLQRICVLRYVYIRLCSYREIFHINMGTSRREKEASPFLKIFILQSAEAQDASGQAATCSAATWSANRDLVVCCVRLSREKEPLRFVRICASLSQADVFKKLGLTPVLFAAGEQGKCSYADEVVREFERNVPEGKVARGFLGVQELGMLFRRTRLNIHPSTYDAYGMTIVEAASQGAPSVIHLVRGPTLETINHTLRQS